MARLSEPIGSWADSSEAAFATRAGLRVAKALCHLPRSESWKTSIRRSSPSLRTSALLCWQAEDRFFSPRLRNSNARSLNRAAAAGNIEVIFPAS